MREGTTDAVVVEEEKEVWEERLAMPKKGQDRRRCRCDSAPVGPQRSVEMRVVGGSRCQGQEEMLREDPKKVGVAAEEEEVQEEGEGLAMLKRDRNRQRRWCRVIWRQIFWIFEPPYAHRRAEGR